MMDRVKAKITAKRTRGGLIGARLGGHETYQQNQAKASLMDSERRKLLKKELLVARNLRIKSK